MAVRRLEEKPHGTSVKMITPTSIGAVLALAAAFLFSVVGLLAKMLQDDASGLSLHVFEVAFFRYLLGLVWLLPLVARKGPSIYRTERVRVHLCRSLAAALAVVCMFYAVTAMPLADALAIAFSEPIFTMVIAFLFLNETVRAHRWVAVAVGFFGVLVMVRPSGGVTDLSALVAVAAAVFLGVDAILVKVLTRTESVATMLVMNNTLGALFTVGPAIAVWQTPSDGHWWLLALLGLSLVLAQLTFIQANRHCEASFLAPFAYSTLIYSGIFGFVFFAESPSTQSLIGAAAIASSGIYLAMRDRKDHGRSAPAPH